MENDHPDVELDYYAIVIATQLRDNYGIKTRTPCDYRTAKI